MGYAENKAEDARAPQTFSGVVAKAKLKAHLACKGYVVTESDALGPVTVLVVGMDSLQEWRRESKDGKDWLMALQGTRKLSYE